MIATLLSGLALGAVYTLVGIGFNLAWLTTRAINFAQGGFVMAGAFLTVFLHSQGLPAVVIFVLLLAIGALVSAVEYSLAIRPVQTRGEHAELVTTVGFITVIQGVILFFVSDDALRVPSLVPSGLIPVPGGFVSPAELLLVVVAVVVGVAAHLWAWHTRFGLAAMGVSEDREAAMILGVDTTRFSYLTFMASGALGFGVAQVVGPETFAVVSLATLISIKGFVALAIGGFGSNLGALIGGLVVGSAETLVARAFGASWQNTAVFVIFVVLMLLRPRGLFGEAKERVV
ncbi:branched-chain amino acid ABC transporter permease [Amycolatopsis sp. NPDC006131]|uniref:branched-chain amino acid ABC transporter permease n=1 Tax=Amycolatopsis sp. NPDC006131 TaxID=3156731 RepID=UPI0033A2B992